MTPVAGVDRTACLDPPQERALVALGQVSEFNEAPRKTVGIEVAAPVDAPADASAAKRRILIVEDNELLGLTTEIALSEAGYEVIGVVASGEEALDMAETTPPDLVLMDIRLAADLDGIDAAIELRRRGVTSIFATGHADESMKIRGESADPAGWLAKPFSHTELLTAVQGALRKARPPAPGRT